MDEVHTPSRRRRYIQNTVVTLVLLFVLALFILATVRIDSFAKNTYRPDLDVALSETRIVFFDAQYFEGWIGGQATLNDPSPFPHDNTTGSFVQLMKFPSEPSLSVSNTYSALLTVNITSNKVYYWSRYFFANSSFFVGWDAYTYLFDRKEPVLYWLVVASDNNHDAFLKAVRDQTSIPAEYTVISTGYASNITYTAQKDNFHFLFLWNNNTFDVRANIKLNITTRILDVSNPIETCMLPCSMNLPYNREGETLVLVSPNANTFVADGYGSANTHFTFHASLRTRTWFIAVILTFIAIGFILVVCIVCCFYTTCDSIGEDVPTRFHEVWKCFRDSGKGMKRCMMRDKYQPIRGSRGSVNAGSRNSSRRASKTRGWADSEEDR